MELESTNGFLYGDLTILVQDLLDNDDLNIDSPIFCETEVQILPKENNNKQLYYLVLRIWKR